VASSSHLKHCSGNLAQVQIGSVGQRFCLRQQGELPNWSLVLGAGPRSAIRCPREPGSTDSAELDGCGRARSSCVPSSQHGPGALAGGVPEPPDWAVWKRYLSLFNNDFDFRITENPGEYIHLSCLQSQEF